jgi:hypothetical protein
VVIPPVTGIFLERCSIFAISIITHLTQPRSE